MKYIFILFIFCVEMTFAQKIYLYQSSQKVTIDGFEKDSSPPFMDYYKAHPDSANGAAILICPGGGYGALADQHEGVDVARYYHRFGYDTFVLHYRLNGPGQNGHRYPDQFNDVTIAMRIIKSKAKLLKFDPARVGIIGFSAGGHLASMGTTMHVPANAKSTNDWEHWDSRPAFAKLIYPVITLGGKPAHQGSRDNLLGKNPKKELVDSLSTQNRVSAKTPPVFLVYSVDDTVVPPENGILFFEALRKNNIPVSLHVFDHGGHGYGLAPKDPVLNTWPWLSVKWIERLEGR